MEISRPMWTCGSPQNILFQIIELIFLPQFYWGVFEVCQIVNIWSVQFDHSISIYINNYHYTQDKNFHHTPQFPYASLNFISPPPIPRQLLIDLLINWHFLEFYINEGVLDVFFLCVFFFFFAWLLSLSVMIWDSSTLLRSNNLLRGVPSDGCTTLSLSTHPLMDVSIVSGFWLLGIKLLWIHVWVFVWVPDFVSPR